MLPAGLSAFSLILSFQICVLLNSILSLSAFALLLISMVTVCCGNILALTSLSTRPGGILTFVIEEPCDHAKSFPAQKTLISISVNGDILLPLHKGLHRKVPKLANEKFVRWYLKYNGVQSAFYHPLSFSS